MKINIDTENKTIQIDKLTFEEVLKEIDIENWDKYSINNINNWTGGYTTLPHYPSKSWQGLTTAIGAIETSQNV